MGGNVSGTSETSLSRFFFGFICCPSVLNRCQVACASKQCSQQCGGKCGIFNLNNCGPYTCRDLSNACFSGVVTTSTSTSTSSTSIASTTSSASTIASASVSSTASTVSTTSSGRMEVS